MSIDNANRNPLIQINDPNDGSYVETGESTIISGVAQDPDGDVNRIDIEIRDVVDEILIDTITLTGSEIDGDRWTTDWDSRGLIHDRPYAILARSFDGIDYSQWDQIEIIADNPPNKDNSRPVFDGAAWVGEFILYCDAENDDILDRCTAATIDLSAYFSDPDIDQDIILAVADDQHAIGIRIDSNGVATYDPDVMAFYTTEISEWNMENVVFLAQDEFGSKVQSDPVDFIVIPTIFSVDPPDKDTLSDTDQGIVFQGTGIPGRAVTAYIDANPANSTVVGDDSTWSLLIPSNRIVGTVTPEFTMGVGDSIYGQSISDGSDQGSDFPLGIVVAVLLMLAVLGFTAVRFIEFDADEPHEATGDDNTERYTRDPDHPGWKWDIEAGEWIPDEAASE